MNLTFLFRKHVLGLTNSITQTSKDFMASEIHGLFLFLDN